MIIPKKKFTSAQYHYLRNVIGEGRAIEDKRILHKLEKLGVLKCVHDTYQQFHVEYVEPFQIEYIGLFCASYEKNAIYPRVIKDFRWLENEWLHFLRMETEPKYFEGGVIKDGVIHVEYLGTEIPLMTYLVTSPFNISLYGFKVHVHGIVSPNTASRFFYYAVNLQNNVVPFRLALPSVEKNRLSGRESRDMPEILKILRVKTT